MESSGQRFVLETKGDRVSIDTDRQVNQSAQGKRSVKRVGKAKAISFASGVKAKIVFFHRVSRTKNQDVNGCRV